MPRTFHSCRCYHPHNIGCAVQVLKLLIMKFSPLLCFLVPLMPKCSHQKLRLLTLRPAFLKLWSADHK
jgi:hypothetical protein